jgi:endonuclease YncB( thermonuclease family)
VIGVFAALVLSVTDGDTFRARVPVWDNIDVVTAVRIRGIDTPEIKGKCPAEKAAALEAKARLAALLNGPVQLLHVEPDKYAGRVDADVTVNGTSVAAVLIAEGLARPYTGGARQGWCP